MPEYANLCGIMYRIQVSEGLVVFTSKDNAWGCLTRISFTERSFCWYIEIHGSHGKAVMVSHVLKAYSLVTEHLGKNHEIHWGKLDKKPEEK